MTTVYQALAALRQEVEDAIVDLAPNSRATTPFRARPTVDRTTPFEAAPPADRLFEMDTITSFSPVSIGSATRQISVRIPLRFWYQVGEGWTDAMLDDADKIAEYFRDNATTASGVSMRVIDQEATTHERLTDDPWQIMTLVLIAVLDISP